MVRGNQSSLTAFSPYTTSIRSNAVKELNTLIIIRQDLQIFYNHFRQTSNHSSQITFINVISQQVIQNFKWWKKTHHLAINESSWGYMQLSARAIFANNLKSSPSKQLWVNMILSSVPTENVTNCKSINHYGTGKMH